MPTVIYQLLETDPSQLFFESESGLKLIARDSQWRIDDSNAHKLQRLTLQTRYLWSSEPRLTIWRGMGRIEEGEPHYKCYERWITCQGSRLQCGMRSMDVARPATFVVRPRWLGWKTEVSLQQGSDLQVLCREWNHGNILQGIDVAPDPWFEESDDWLWALELAFRLAQQFPGTCAEHRFGQRTMKIASWPPPYVEQ